MANETSNDVLEERISGLRRDHEKLDASVRWVWRAWGVGMIGLVYEILGGGLAI